MEKKIVLNKKKERRERVEIECSPIVLVGQVGAGTMHVLPTQAPYRQSLLNAQLTPVVFPGLVLLKHIALESPETPS